MVEIPWGILLGTLLGTMNFPLFAFRVDVLAFPEPQETIPIGMKRCTMSLDHTLSELADCLVSSLEDFAPPAVWMVLGNARRSSHQVLAKFLHLQHVRQAETWPEIL